MDYMIMTLVYAALAPVSVAVSLLYGEALIVSGKSRGLRKDALAICSFLIMAGYIFLILFAPYELLGLSRAGYNSKGFRWITFVVSIISLIPAYMVFRNRYMKRLKRLGFFK